MASDPDINLSLPSRADNPQATQVNHVWLGLEETRERAEDGRPASIQGTVVLLGRPPKALSTGPKAVRALVYVSLPDKQELGGAH